MNTNGVPISTETLNDSGITTPLVPTSESMASGTESFVAITPVTESSIASSGSSAVPEVFQSPTTTPTSAVPALPSSTTELSITPLVPSDPASSAAEPTTTFTSNGGASGVQAEPASGDETSQDPPQLSAAPSGSAALSLKSGGTIIGLAYDILKGGPPGTCKTAEEVKQEMAFFKNNGFTHVRLYATTCQQVELVTSNAAALGMQVIISIPDLTTLSQSLPQLISQAGSNLGTIDTIAIGNEYVNGGGSVQDVLNALGYARGYLPGAGFGGSIVTIDTCTAMLAHPELCTNSDYCAANCHAFFDADNTSADAGSYVHGMAAQLASKTNGQRVVITESGWPWQGDPNGAAVPSLADQQTAVAALKSAFGGSGQNLVLFQAFDTLYKSPGAFGVEPYFGIQSLASGQAP